MDRAHPATALHMPEMVVSAVEQLPPALSGSTINPGGEKGRSFNTNACLAVADVPRWGRAQSKPRTEGKRREIEERSSIMAR